MTDNQIMEWARQAKLVKEDDRCAREFRLFWLRSVRLGLLKDARPIAFRLFWEAAWEARQPNR